MKGATKQRPRGRAPLGRNSQTMTWDTAAGEWVETPVLSHPQRLRSVPAPMVIPEAVQRILKASTVEQSELITDFYTARTRSGTSTVEVALVVKGVIWVQRLTLDFDLGIWSIRCRTAHDDIHSDPSHPSIFEASLESDPSVEAFATSTPTALPPF